MVETGSSPSAPAAPAGAAADGNEGGSLSLSSASSLSAAAGAGATGGGAAAAGLADQPPRFLNAATAAGGAEAESLLSLAALSSSSSDAAAGGGGGAGAASGFLAPTFRNIIVAARRALAKGGDLGATCVPTWRAPSADRAIRRRDRPHAHGSWHAMHLDAHWASSLCPSLVSHPFCCCCWPHSPPMPPAQQLWSCTCSPAAVAPTRPAMWPCCTVHPPKAPIPLPAARAAAHAPPLAQRRPRRAVVAPARVTRRALPIINPYNQRHSSLLGG